MRRQLSRIKKILHCSGKFEACEENRFTEFTEFPLHLGKKSIVCNNAENVSSTIAIERVNIHFLGLRF